MLAWNESTNETGYYEVTATFSHLDPVLTELIIAGEWIETTPEHPFYVEGKGWTPAGDLEFGDQIRQADGEFESVWLKWDIQKYQEMYNLTVDEAHTYFVGEGQWLVHNDCEDLLDSLPIRPNDKGPTTGILVTDGEELLFKSGVVGPAKYKLKGWEGFDIVTRTHVEGDVAADMWQKGVQKATLLINNPPCPSCSKLLPKMLPLNSILRVIATNGFNQLFRSIR